MSDWSSDAPSESEEALSDVSEGRGEDEGTSGGKELGTCGSVEKDFAGAKSSSVKM